jgi:hypothetical protein
MPYGSEFLGNVGTGLMDFAGSGLGQTAIGAGLGYGIDKLAGGKGGTGAILGGLGGLMNYGTGSGGNLFGEGTSNFDSTALGGLFGSGTNQAQNQYQQQAGLIDPKYLQDPSVTGALQSGYENIPKAGLLDRASGFQKQYGGLFGGVGDVASAYGQYQTGQANRANSKSEIDYRNRIATLNEQEANRNFANQAATNQAATDAFSKSKLRNYYSA